MKIIKGFESFNESTMLRVINETVLYFLPGMRSALTDMMKDGDKIADMLLGKANVDTQKDITLVDLEGDKLSFMTKSAIDSRDPELMKKFADGFGVTRGDMFNSVGNRIKEYSNRNQINIGKFVNSVLGVVPAKDLEDFVNKLKSKRKGYEIKIVEGDDIKKYYRTSALIVGGSQNPHLGSSEIMKSCMRDKEKTRSNVFDIYVKNVESCKMVVMLDGNANLVSRAILWKVVVVDNDSASSTVVLDLPESFWFMDRVYSVENWMDKYMYDWVAKKGYASKSGNKGHTDIVFNGVGGPCDMEVDVKKIAYKGFPFMDTFIYYDVKNGKLRNFEGHDFKGLILQTNTGGYEKNSNSGAIFRNYIRRFR